MNELKLNIGSGHRRFEGYYNVDNDPLVNPDYIVELDSENVHLPFEDDSVDEFYCHHILEHIRAIIPLFQEMYRTGKHGAIVDIEVPHHQHDSFYGDLTHVRPISVAAMCALDKEFDTLGSSSSTGTKYNVDFKMIHFDFEYDGFYAGMINDYKERQQKGMTSPEEDMMITRLCREGCNVAVNTKMRMMINKR